METTTAITIMITAGRQGDGAHDRKLPVDWLCHLQVDVSTMAAYFNAPGVLESGGACRVR